MAGLTIYIDNNDLKKAQKGYSWTDAQNTTPKEMKPQGKYNVVATDKTYMTTQQPKSFQEVVVNEPWYDKIAKAIFPAEPSNGIIRDEKGNMLGEQPIEPLYGLKDPVFNLAFLGAGLANGAMKGITEIGEKVVTNKPLWTAISANNIKDRIENEGFVEGVLGHPIETTLDLSMMGVMKPAVKAMTKPLEFAVNVANPKYRALHAYDKIFPVGYGDKTGRLKNWVKSMWKDEYINIDNPSWKKEKQKIIDKIINDGSTTIKNELENSGMTGAGIYLAKDVKHRGIIADMGREDAWRIYNGLKPKYNIFIKTGEGKYTYNIPEIQRLSENTWHPELPSIGGDLNFDFFTGAGGGVNYKTIGNEIIYPDGLYNINGKKVNPKILVVSKNKMSDIWDLNPLQSGISNDFNRKFPFLNRLNWGLSMRQKGKNLRYVYDNWGEMIDETQNPIKRQFGKILENFGNSLVKKGPTEFKLLDKAVKNFEVGTITGGKPFLVETEFPIISYEDNLGLHNEFGYPKLIQEYQKNNKNILDNLQLTNNEYINNLKDINLTTTSPTKQSGGELDKAQYGTQTKINILDDVNEHKFRKLYDSDNKSWYTGFTGRRGESTNGEVYLANGMSNAEIRKEFPGALIKVENGVKTFRLPKVNEEVVLPKVESKWNTVITLPNGQEERQMMALVPVNNKVTKTPTYKVTEHGITNMLDFDSQWTLPRWTMAFEDNAGKMYANRYNELMNEYYDNGGKDNPMEYILNKDFDEVQTTGEFETIFNTPNSLIWDTTKNSFVIVDSNGRPHYSYDYDWSNGWHSTSDNYKVYKPKQNKITTIDHNAVKRNKFIKEMNDVNRIANMLNAGQNRTWNLQYQQGGPTGLTIVIDDEQFKKGGQIHIKEKNKGKFTKQAQSAGMSVQEFARHVLAHKDRYPASTVKRANFARNASKWSK